MLEGAQCCFEMTMCNVVSSEPAEQQTAPIEYGGKNVTTHDTPCNFHKVRLFSQ